MSNTNTKIIVTVHGVGDQIGYASAQSVAYQFCRYCDQPAAIPLGRFHPKFADQAVRFRLATSQKIRWWNYLDRGDPIAYRLDKTREWLNETREKEGVRPWSDYFDFKDEEGPEKRPHEKEFSRYDFPGKAHIDYWDDAELFGHFIQNVVGVPQWYGLRLMSVAAVDGLVNEGRNW